MSDKTQNNKTPDNKNLGAESHSEMAKLYDQVWAKGTYRGFSRGTSGQKSTPFLDTFVKEVKQRKGTTSPRVIEFGAGSGDHSLRLADEGFRVSAVESSAAAVAQLRERLEMTPDKIEILNQDLFDYVKGLSSGMIDGVYSNAVFHFLTIAERTKIYKKLQGAQTDHGILAISFKGAGDSLQNRGRVVEDTVAGPVVEGDEGIRRLFVTNPKPLVQEMVDSGYQLAQMIEWSIPDYNIPGEAGKFVGIIATKA